MHVRPALSVVVPLYNEEESVRPLHRRIRAACEALGRPYEVVYVDDGSRDGTLAAIEEIHRQDRAVRAVVFRRNYGQTAAMAAGFRMARGRTIVSMDGDLQNDPADIGLLLDTLDDGYDVVCGWRRGRKDRLVSRRIPSMIANWLIGWITGVPIRDSGCSLKAYRAEVIKATALYADLHRFIPAMATLTGARITEVPVRHHARPFGRSKYGIGRAWRVFLDLFVIKMLTGFGTRPALWFGTGSLLAGGVGSGCLAALLLPGTSGVVLPALSFLGFCLAGHLAAVGVMGEMVLQTGGVSGRTPVRPAGLQDAGEPDARWRRR